MYVKCLSSEEDLDFSYLMFKMNPFEMLLKYL